jgi:hypothetical protein
MRQAGEPERARSQQLVVGHHEGGRRISDVHAAGCKPLELAGAALDAVEPFAYVEPGQRDVPRLEGRQRSVRVDQLGLETPVTRRGDERIVRRAAPMGDDGELHAEIVRTERTSVGLDPVKQWCRTRYPAAAAPSRAAAFGTGSSR